MISSDTFIGEGAYSLCLGRKGEEEVEKTFRIFNKGKGIGNVRVIYKVNLDEDCKEHPEVKAPDTSGTLTVKPKKAYLLRDVKLFGKMDGMATVRLGEEN